MKQMSGLSPLPREMLYTRAADEIRHYIETNQLQEGDRLPAERALAESLNISRNSVREALRILELRGIIDVKTGKGTFVSKSVEGPSMFINMVRINFLEMLEIKVTLEALAIRQATAVMQPCDYDELEALARQMMEDHRHTQYDEELDIRFHKLLMSFVPNLSLSDMICDMIDLFTNYWREIGTDERYQNMLNPALLDTIPYHLDMILAMRKGDVDKAIEIHHTIYNIDVEVLNLIQQ